jgi:putative transcriptional regulator
MSTAAAVPVRFRLQDLLDARNDGMSQAELARRAGLSNTAVNEIALNKTTRVSLATIDALCQALNVEPGDLFDYAPDKKAAGRKRAATT